MNVLTLAAAAEGVAEAVPAGAETFPMWAQIFLATVSTLITALLLPFLKHKAEAAAAEAEKHKIDSSKSLIEQRSILTIQVKSFLLDSAFVYVEKEFPKIIERIKDGDLTTKEQVKLALRALGAQLKQECVDYFEKEGIDLVATLGDAFLDRTIQRIADKVSPFAGKDSAVELLKSGVTNLLLKKGVDWLRNKYLDPREHRPVEETEAAA